METIQLKKQGVLQAYNSLIEQLGSYIEAMANQEKPFTSLVGMKRQLYRLKALLNNGQEEPIKTTQKLDTQSELYIDEMLKEFGIDVREGLRIGLFTKREIKKVLIKKKYFELAKKGLSYKEIKGQLSKEFEVSVSSIEKVVYKN